MAFKRCIIALSLFFIAHLALAATAPATPVGYWKQISDVNNKPRSIIQIWQKKNVLYGRVVTGFYIDGKAPRKTCHDCPGHFKGKPIMGMHILWGFSKESKTEWGGGRILDPNRGSIYRCELTLSKDNKTLNVRGYIGIPLFGRSQTWHRLTETEAKQLSKKAYQTVL